MQLKILFNIIAFLCTTTAFAVPMCVSNDTVTIVLDPSVKSDTTTYDQSLATWEARYQYGTITGISACLSSNYGQVLGGTIANLTDKGALVVGGEQNGQYCWCKMTHPFVSQWVYLNSRSNPATCARGATNSCARFCTLPTVATDEFYRGMFGSIGN